MRGAAKDEPSRNGMQAAGCAAAGVLMVIELEWRNINFTKYSIVYNTSNIFDGVFLWLVLETCAAKVCVLLHAHHNALSSIDIWSSNTAVELYVSSIYEVVRIFSI